MSTGIYKRGKTFWITYMGADGKQKWESSGSRLKADADYLLACRKKEVAEGLIPVTSHRKQFTVTFDELAEKYSEFCKSQRGFEVKRYRIATLCAEFGNRKVVTITLEELERFQQRRLSANRPAKKEGAEPLPPVKPASVNKEFAALKHMFTKADQWGLIPRTTLDMVRKVKPVRENNKRLRFLSVEECSRLLAECTPGVREMVVFALNTGCRRGEIFDLKWQHVDLKHGHIRIADSKNGEARDIPVNSTLSALLRGLVRHLDSPYVFVNPETVTRYQDIKHSFATACQKAGLDDFHFHDLRHTFASHLVMNGVDLLKVSRLLGHKTLTMTLRYAHLAPDHLKKAVDVLTWIPEQQATG